MDSLFDTSAPLASRLRPDSLDEYVGQRHLLDPGGILYLASLRKRPVPILLILVR